MLFFVTAPGISGTYILYLYEIVKELIVAPVYQQC